MFNMALLEKTTGTELYAVMNGAKIWRYEVRKDGECYATAHTQQGAYRLFKDFSQGEKRA